MVKKPRPIWDPVAKRIIVPGEGGYDEAALEVERMEQEKESTKQEVKRERSGRAQERLAAMTNSQMICPHCQTKGSVITQKTKVKRGISGGKATGALLTGGASLLATGLSRKQKATQARCVNCGAEWLF